MPDTRFFLDSNVAIYALGQEAGKRDIAVTLMACGPVVSTQALTEIANVARRKLHLPVAAVREIVDAVEGTADVRIVTVATVRRALDLAERYGFSTYDSLIVAAAIEAGCGTLYSEDLQHGQRIGDDLVVVNPFRQGQ